MALYKSVYIQNKNKTKSNQISNQIKNRVPIIRKQIGFVNFDETKYKTLLK